MKRLYLISESGVQTVEYMHKNGVIPYAYIAEPSRYQDIVPYLTKEDEVLLVIQGLTSFTMVEIYALLSKLEEHKDKISKYTVMSNLYLGVVPYDYYLYSGDLFYGDVKKVVDNKVYGLDGKGRVLEQRSRGIGFNLGKKEEQKLSRNPIMTEFKKFNDKKTSITIYGKLDLDKSIESFDNEYINRIMEVDLYKE